MSRQYQIRQRVTNKGINLGEEGEISRFSFDRLKNNKKRQEDEGRKLYNIMEEKGFENTNEFGLKHLKIVQKYWDEKFPGLYRIIAFDRQRGLKPIWKGTGQRKYEVCIVHDGSHWHGLKSVGQYFPLGQLTYCADCEVTYKEDVDHRIECKARCKQCCRRGYGFPCPKEEGLKKSPITCSHCHRDFYNINCYEAHKEKACDVYHRCLGKCKLDYRVENGHTCGEKYCFNCSVHHDPKRPCFIMPIFKKKLEKQPNYRIVVYDAECTANNVITQKSRHEGKSEHLANFISARWTCTKCLDKVQDCAICGPESDGRHKKWIALDGTNPTEEFVKWVTSFGSYPTVAYAHYGGLFLFNLFI